MINSSFFNKFFIGQADFLYLLLILVQKTIKQAENLQDVEILWKVHVTLP